MMDKKTLKILNKMRKYVKKKIKKDNIRLDIKGVKERMEQNENKWENSFLLNKNSELVIMILEELFFCM